MIYGIIYKYTNPLNNKSYIGQTINENRRKYEHAHITSNRKGKFSSAIKKYGIEHFTYKVLYKIPSNNIDRLYIMLSILESKEIKRFNTISNGYNTLKGGRESYVKCGNVSKSLMGHTLSEVTKFKISEAHKGKVISEYTRQLLSDKLKGRKHSEEHNRKVSESNLNNPKKCKPIYKCDKKGNIICSYNSLKEASADTGILLGGISKVLIGNRPTAGGYIWKYKN